MVQNLRNICRFLLYRVLFFYATNVCKLTPKCAVFLYEAILFLRKIVCLLQNVEMLIT